MYVYIYIGLCNEGVETTMNSEDNETNAEIHLDILSVSVPPLCKIA